jgi:cell division septation protein DedD
MLASAFGVGVGYVLGAAAGRERFEQIKSQAQRIVNDPEVRQKVADLPNQVKENLPKAQSVVADQVSDVKSDDSPSDSFDAPYTAGSPAASFDEPVTTLDDPVTSFDAPATSFDAPATSTFDAPATTFETTTVESTFDAPATADPTFDAPSTDRDDRI